MKWDKIRSHYPQKWLLVEALEAHSIAGKRIVEDLAVVEDFTDSAEAMRRYMQLHNEAPSRELYVIHTSREEIDITERMWFGIRAGP